MDHNFLLNKKVLVAEDNTINQVVVKHTLLKLGAEADIVNDGLEAIEQFKNKKYDLVLMDIQMPNMDGYEAAQHIRVQLQNNTPIIAMTAFALNGEDEKCFEAGMNGYVAKPFTFESLGNTIQKILSSSAPMINTNPHILFKEDVTVDVSMLYEVSANDEVYIQLMVNTFLENMPVTLKKIEDSFNQKDFETLYSSAHYAKSSLSVIKINEMLEWVQKIEAAAKQKINVEALPALIDKVKTRFSIAQSLLTARFAASVSNPV